jgi:diguanylate cyclase (GGDEF)-like protein
VSTVLTGPSAEDRLALREHYTLAFTSRLPTIAAGLVSMHLIHLVAFALFVPGTALEADWRMGVFAAHATEAVLVFGVVGWTRWLWRRENCTAAAYRTLMLAFGSYLLLGGAITAADQLRGLSPFSYALAAFGVALVMEAAPAVALCLYSAAALVAVLALARVVDDPVRRLSLAVNIVGVSAAAFAVSQLVLQWRQYGFWRHRAAERAVADLHAPNARLAEEIDRRRAIEVELADLAHRDPLTEVANRRGFVSAMEAAGKAGGGALLLVDLDHLKGMNDTHGHAVGDDALRAVSRALRASVRSDDTVARLGGDEFGVLLPGADEAHARKVAAALVAAVAAAPLTGPVPSLTVSVGLTAFAPGERKEEALARADAALYRAKSAGRNTVSD